MSYRVYGKIRRTDNNSGIPGLHVKAYDSDWITSDDYLGSDITNSNGDFEITFRKSDFDAGWWDPEGGPDVFLKIYHNNTFIHKTSTRNGSGKNTYFDIKLNPQDLLGEYTVSGVVKDARSKRNLCNLNVEAWDDDLIFDDKLGKDKTDNNGTYLIPFTKSQFRGFFDWENHPDVFIKVKNDAGKRLAKSSIRRDSGRHTVINAEVKGIEISESISECVYGWTARYRQEGTHIIVCIQLNPDDDVTDTEMEILRERWKTGIENKWSNHFACCCDKNAKNTNDCSNFGNLTFEVRWVTENPHHTVRVRRGPERSNMTTWDTSDSGNVASHEFGHMMGHPDEYSDSNCPGRTPVNTGTVMDDNTETVSRLYNRFCKLLNENTVEVS